MGTFRPNAFGLYDMHGNAYQWCADWYDVYPAGPRVDPEGPREGVCRVLRGGSWANGVGQVRSAMRHGGHEPESRCDDVGFRVVAAPDRE